MARKKSAGEKPQRMLILSRDASCQELYDDVKKAIEKEFAEKFGATVIILPVGTRIDCELTQEPL